jgi:hypothetical protein
MNRHGRRTDLGLSVGIAGIAQHTPGNQAFRHLNLIASIFELGYSNFGIAADPEKVGVIELKFGAGSGSHGNGIAGHQRGIQYCGNPVTGIAAPHRRIAIDDTQARDCLAGLILRLGRSVTL